MGAGFHQPYLYEAESNRSRLPEKPFDPKAATRASWEQKPIPAKRKGPLVEINRHPDAYEVIGGQRSYFRPMSQRTKTLIKVMRVVQLIMRVLQLAGAIGIFVLMILINHVADVTAWVMRITAAVVASHCLYGIYHHAKPAGARSPGSSAAYQGFSGFYDFCVVMLYTYGALATNRHGDDWSTLLHDKSLIQYLRPAFYYTLIGDAGLHLLTLAVALWLGIQFRRITMMPPDRNPLESRFTSRAQRRQHQQQEKHKRNKSSIVTTGTLEPIDAASVVGRPPAVPFMHTREQASASLSGSSTRVDSAHRDSRQGLPSQQMQTATLCDSPRSSVTITYPPKRSSAASSYRTALENSNDLHGSALENSNGLHGPLGDGQDPSLEGYSQLPTSYAAGGRRPKSGAGAVPRAGKFTETWYTSDSLIDRTQQRNRALNTMMLNAAGKRRHYEMVSQAALDGPDSDDHVSDEGDRGNDDGHVSDEGDRGNDDGQDDPHHPNPLRSHPLQSSPMPRSPGSPAADVVASAPAGRPLSLSHSPSMTSSVSSTITYRQSDGYRRGQAVLGEGHGSGGDIADAMESAEAAAAGLGAVQQSRNLTAAKPQKRRTSKRWTWMGARENAADEDGAVDVSSDLPSPLFSSKSKRRSQPMPPPPRPRDSSIQPETQFYSKPYGQLKPSTPPILVGQDARGRPEGRQVSSGNDFDLGSRRMDSYALADASAAESTFGRRNVSGKIAEEGRAYSRYSVLS